MLIEHRIRAISSILGTWLCAVVLAGCTTTTRLEVRFDADTPGNPPSVTQTLGTLLLEQGAGSVVVVDTPAPDVTPPGKKWARISHPTPITPQTSMRAMMPTPAGDGSFTVTAVLYVPSGGAVPTIQLEPFGTGLGYASFLHVDLLTDGTLRVDDDEIFGHFPHDQLFLLSIQLELSDTATTARIAPVGAGTSGSIELPIAVPTLARSFGAVRVWMGFQFGGTFFIDDLVVVERERS